MKPQPVEPANDALSIVVVHKTPSLFSDQLHVLPCRCNWRTVFGAGGSISKLVHAGPQGVNTHVWFIVGSRPTVAL